MNVPSHISSLRFIVVVAASVIAATCLAPSPADAAVEYILTDLGALSSMPGEDSSVGYGANDLGHAVGQTYPVEGPRAFLWQNGVMTNLGSLGGTSVAFDVNNSGQVVGRYDVGSDYRGFVWENGVMTALDTLGGTTCRANAINNAGQIVGFAKIAAGGGRACMWENGTAIDLGTLGKGSYAYDINEAGDVVGQSDLVSGGTRAFLLSDGVMHDLGTLGGNQSWSRGINDLGQVVGGWEPAGGYAQPFLWEDSVMIDLGLNGGLYGDASDINNRGEIVGKISMNIYGMYRAFLWKNGTMYWLDELELDVPGSWEFTSAEAVNENGQIVGTYIGPGGLQRAYMLTPIPEPGTLGLVGLGLATLALRRRGK